MSCEIIAFIVHKMVPAQQPRLIAEFGTGILEHNESIQSLMDTLNQRYVTQGGRTFGQFSVDQTNYPISNYLDNQDILNKPENFYNLSKDILKHLVIKASATSATGGWVLVCLYKHNTEQILAVAVVNEITGASIDNSFRVQPTIYIDLAKLRHAGRINLTKWKNGQTGYVNFIKAVRESTYFKEFLGCDTTNSSVVETDKVITAINAYCDAKGLLYEERQQITSRAHDFLKSASKTNSPVHLAHLANHLVPENTEELTTFLVSDEYQINDDFIPDGRTLRKLIELGTKSRLWNVKINREAFQNGAEYDIETNMLKIPVTDAEERELFRKEVEGIDDHDDDQ